MRSVGLVAVSLLGGCIPSTFACTDDEQCSLSAQGQCEPNGACSYPDDACDSGRRFSGFGRSDASACVPLPAETTGGASTSASTSASTPTSTTTTGDASSSTANDDDTENSGSSGPSVDCDEACSDRGRCVLVDGAPTCACDPGWAMVGLECLEDPCDSEQCYFVDAEAGDDEGPGTRESPWQSQARAWTQLEVSMPGDHILFRRGLEYVGASDAVSVLGEGTSSAPVVVGAYGPPEDERPLLSSSHLRILNGEHLVFRDLAITGSIAQPCLNIVNSGFITLHDNELAECGFRGVRITDRSDHVVVFRNEFRDVGPRSAIFVADDTAQDPALRVGSHHWVADNAIRNNERHGIEIGFEPANHVTGDGDVKVVGNQIGQVERSGVRFVGGAGWVEGNVVVENTGTYAGFDVGGDLVRLEGNITALTGRGFMVRDTAAVSRNTVVLSSGSPVVWFVGDVSDVTFSENLLFAQAGPVLLYEANGPQFAELDRNVYGREKMAACEFQLPDATTDLAGWREYTGLAVSSGCDVVPGLEIPPTGVPVDDDFWGAVTPARGWDGCEVVGAVRCDGLREPVEIEPLPQIDDNGGRGWEGPLLIQQHYPL